MSNEANRGVPFAKGNSGRPRGSRNKLTSKFIKALLDDFASHGTEALKIVRLEQPLEYLKLIGSLVPREVDPDASPVTLSVRWLGPRDRMIDHGMSGPREVARMPVAGGLSPPVLENDATADLVAAGPRNNSAEGAEEVGADDVVSEPEPDEDDRFRAPLDDMWPKLHLA